MGISQYPLDFFSLSSKSYTVIGVVSLVAYLILVQVLRFHRVRSATRRYGYISKDAIEHMTQQDAEVITRNIGELEFPTVNELALQFALFRTYGIPTVSHLLHKTGQFSNPKTSQKRYVDTVVIISEFAANQLDSFRAQKSIERLNWLHGRHKISNDDMLYTLALFMCQPTKFINEMEWRQITDMEKKAIWMFWRAIGQRMNIQDIPDSFEEMRLWAEDYETKHMIPAESNRLVAAQTISILLYFAPKCIHHYARQIIYTVMDPRLRTAMDCPTPAPIYKSILTCIISTRRFFLRHLMLPRYGRVRKIGDHPINPEEPQEMHRYHYKAWDTDPWYVKPSLWAVYGPGSWVCRVMGWGLPGDQFYGDKGYRIMELGPQHLEKYGPGNEGWRTKSSMGGGCPMAFS